MGKGASHEQKGTAETNGSEEGSNAFEFTVLGCAGAFLVIMVVYAGIFIILPEILDLLEEGPQACSSQLGDQLSMVIASATVPTGSISLSTPGENPIFTFGRFSPDTSLSEIVLTFKQDGELVAVCTSDSDVDVEIPCEGRALVLEYEDNADNDRLGPGDTLTVLGLQAGEWILSMHELKSCERIDQVVFTYQELSSTP